MRSGTSLAVTLMAGTSLIGATAQLHAAPAAVALPAVPPASVAAPPTSTIQQQFDAGTAAIAAGEWARALEIYTTLETKLATRTPASKSLAVVRLRKGQMLSRLGRAGEAEAIIRAALPLVSATDVNLRGERFESYLALANIAERRFDYPMAVAYLNDAHLTAPSPFAELSVFMRSIQLNIFVDPDAALATTDAALAIIKQNPNTNKEWTGVFRNLRGRTLLNMGRIKEARAELKAAVDTLGVLGTERRINLLDATARSDAAIAAFRDGKPDEARNFLAYAGTAQASDEGFRLGENMNPPQCGGKDGAKPEDVAIVEFNIKDDGSVGFARPVFFSGNRATAVQFAEAVSDWNWTPEALVKVSPFYRALNRVELRCTTVFDRPAVASLIQSDFDNWLATKSVAVREISAPTEAGVIAKIKLELISRSNEFGNDSVQLLRSLIHLAAFPGVPGDLAKTYAEQALSIARANGAPIAAQTYLRLFVWSRLDGGKADGRDPVHQAIAAAFNDPDLAGNARSLAAARLYYFDWLNSQARLANGAAILQPVADDVRLGERDPFRVGALTRMAGLAAATGKIDDARSLFAKTGLSAQQCALADARPVQTSGSLGRSDFPNEALRFGFGGWTVVEFDIAANGLTANRRALIAWPPFVFGDAATKGLGTFKYSQSYRPDGAIGCGGQQQRISYKIGGIR